MIHPSSQKIGTKQVWSTIIIGHQLHWMSKMTNLVCDSQGFGLLALLAFKLLFDIRQFFSYLITKLKTLRIGGLLSSFFLSCKSVMLSSSSSIFLMCNVSDKMLWFCNVTVCTRFLRSVLPFLKFVPTFSYRITSTIKKCLAR